MQNIKVYSWWIRVRFFYNDETIELIKKIRTSGIKHN